MAPEVFYARAVIALVRGWADKARREGRNEIGASAVEWAIISAVVVVLALLVGNVIRNVVTENVSEIK